MKAMRLVKSLPQETHPEQAEKPERGDLQEFYNKPSIIRLARSTDAGSNDARTYAPRPR